MEMRPYLFQSIRKPEGLVQMVDITKDQLLKLSLAELDALSNLVAETRKERAIALKQDVKSRIEAMVREAGVSIGELFAGFGASDDKPKGKRTYTKSDGTKVAKAKGEPVFRHPENPSLTYSGKGRRPAWFADHIANGGSEADLRINKAA
ncbi:MAG: spbB [Cypionkella sp.]|uniref:H-NS histone family protein n=1 Tax=Cypionkella sp. TaxID=2811411 RepID=UPI0026205E52|nr:H-NS histone family protein [Cypionkella sp.]MDB5659533.1 spbB [Cypionkella sp.]